MVNSNIDNLASNNGTPGGIRTHDKRFRKACLIVKTGSFVYERGLSRLQKKPSLWRRVRSGKNAFGLV
jgi:hypothetical protein